MPQLLADASLKSIARYLSSDICDNGVFILCGAGISTSAGIPDFRSPTTGLYANLAKLNLPYPEAVFDINFFLDNPQPFYTLARDIAPGKFVPTPTHAFIRLLHERGKLHTCFTQNIDTLERKAGVPPDKVVEAHGSFASSRCVQCKAPYDDRRMMEHIAYARVPRCPEPDCGGLVKPDIVFFGESLPPEFITAVPALRSAALVIIMGTSLKVQPFAMLPNLVPRTGCPRLLLNLDPAGTIGIKIPRQPRPPQRVSRDEEGGVASDSDDDDDAWEEEHEEEEEPTWEDDVVHLGDCDSSVRDLCDLLGWRSELERIWKEGKEVGGGDSGSAEPEGERADTPATTADDIGIFGKTFGSIDADSEENARKSPRAPGAGLKPTIYPHAEAEDADADAAVVSIMNNSVEKTMDRIILDLEVALNISPNPKPSPVANEDISRAPLVAVLGKDDTTLLGAVDQNTQPTAMRIATADPSSVMNGEESEVP